jgi:hypothetical protein
MGDGSMRVVIMDRIMVGRRLMGGRQADRPCCASGRRVINRYKTGWEDCIDRKSGRVMRQLDSEKRELDVVTLKVGFRVHYVL